MTGNVGAGARGDFFVFPPLPSYGRSKFLERRNSHRRHTFYTRGGIVPSPREHAMLHDVEHNRRLVEVEHAVAARDAAVGDFVLIGSAAIIVLFAAAIYFAIAG